MSSEPTTHGKVILKTTLGDIEIELWTKEAPLTTRNFIQLCMEGYYDGCIFHRIIPKFIAQTGDPTGTGDGGESIYDGKPFKDEFHSRLRFSRRGIVGMASGKEPNSNQSQFFITLDAAEQLTRRHTVFGRVIGDSLFNILKANELEVDEHDVPLFPPKILSTDVISNPFEDIEPRELKKKAITTATTSVEKKKKPVAAATKNKGLLSFGQDDDDDDDDDDGDHNIIPKSKTKSVTQSPQPTTAKVSKSEKIFTTATTTTSTTNPLPIKKENNGDNDKDIKKETQKQLNSTTQEHSHDPKSFEDLMRGSMLQKAAHFKREREEAESSVNDSGQQQNNNNNNNNNDESTTTTMTGAIKKVKSDKKIVGSLSFKPTRPKGIGGDDSGRTIGPPRVVKKEGGEQSILDRLNQFKKKIKEKPKDEDEEWQSHKFQFKYDPSAQNHYLRDE